MFANQVTLDLFVKLLAPAVSKLLMIQLFAQETESVLHPTSALVTQPLLEAFVIVQYVSENQEILLVLVMDNAQPQIIVPALLVMRELIVSSPYATVIAHQTLYLFVQVTVHVLPQTAVLANQDIPASNARL